MAVVIDSTDLDGLDRKIKANIGNCIQFTNGCWLDLIEDDGMYWGECPYSNVWGCNVNDDYIDTIITWLKFWNEAHTENGEIIKRVVG
ncbi:MAG: hypothetical protein CBB95_17515 [Alteromonas sp. TMED35]|uniref:hypothetical protein n=1 Tax=uncultured Alteromonas sp. TaxID=179113 RepID=UPI000B737AF5|nr:MAG: hypothetical protein CBB95_17515 [Alteromonas sp. TMED35]